MGHIQIVNEKFRDEYLNQNVFLSLHDARRTVGIWRQDITAATPQLIGLADAERISRKEYNL